MTIHSDTPIGNDSKIPASALWLGLTGLIPFIAGMLLVFQEGADIFTSSQAKLFLLGYGAVILSFLGGVRWGLGLNQPNDRDQTISLMLSVIPSLIGWLALLLPFTNGLLLLAIAFVFQGFWDIRSMKSGAGPLWYGSLRRLLTIIVSTLLAVTWINLKFL